MWSAPKRRAAVAAAILLVTVTVALAVWIPTSRPRPELQSRRALVRLTSSSGLNVDPALSPDGALLAYASDREGTSGLDIWIQPVGGTARRLTSEDGDEAEPSVSPDGASIFYSRREKEGH